MKRLLFLGAMLLVFTGCNVENVAEENLFSVDGKLKTANSGPISLGVPMLDCGAVSQNDWWLNISAGQHGAPGGFKLQWMKAADYEAGGEVFPETACTKKFDSPQHLLSDAGNSYALNLAQLINNQDGGCFEGWSCEDEFVFRIRAENPPGNHFKASAWSTPFYCVAQACEDICLYGFGYWKNHGPNSPGQQGDLWPIAESLEIGYIARDKLELANMLNKETKGDPVTSLIQQLIAAKFNVLIGGDALEIDVTIGLADEIVANPQNFTRAQINEVKDVLETFNQSTDCED